MRSAEGVELHMPLAGPPRMLAYTIDATLLWFGLLILFVTVSLLKARRRSSTPYSVT